MARTRRFLTSMRPGHRASAAGFSLIEVIVALGLLVTVMATTAGFFTTSLKQSNGQTQAQEAAVLADQQLDYTRSVTSGALLSGRTQQPSLRQLPPRLLASTSARTSSRRATGTLRPSRRTRQRFPSA